MKKTRIFTLALFLFTKLLFAQPFIGEIRLFAGNFAPVDWAFCDGSVLPIADYGALFSIIGTTYGGDGVDTFALPDFRGRVPIGFGQGPGLSNHFLGEMGGQETVTLTTANMPSHTHLGQIVVNNGNATANVPTATSSIATSGGIAGRAFAPNLSYNSNTPDILITTVTTSSTGSSVPVSISRPRLGLNHIISLSGMYPTFN